MAAQQQAGQAPDIDRVSTLLEILRAAERGVNNIRELEEVSTLLEILHRALRETQQQAASFNPS